MGFLRPVAMTKVGLLGLKADRERIVGLLHDAGVVQIEPLRKEAAAILGSEPGGEAQRKVAELLLRFRTLKSALPARRTGRLPAYPDQAAILREAASVTIDGEVTSLRSEEDQLLTEQKLLGERIDLLSQHRYYTEPLGLLRSHRLLAFFGEAEPGAYAELRAATATIAESAFVPHVEPKRIRFLLAVPTEAAEALGRLAQQSGVKLTSVPPLDGTIAEEVPRAQARRREVDARLGEIRVRLGQIADQGYDRVAALEEALAIENRKFEAWSRMGAGDSTFALEGWIPSRELARLTQGLRSATEDRCYLYPLPTHEEPPTLMDNPPGIRWFEFFIRFYAIPRGTEFDPTWIFALVFPIFFGFMIGDVGFAVIILGFCLWMIAGFPGGRYLPSGIKGIPKMIMGPSTMRSLAYTLVPGCIIGMGLGVVYNSWLGFSLPFYTAYFNPIAQVGELLLISGYIGLAMVSLGFLLGMAKARFHHHRGEFLARLGGLVLAWSLALFGLAILRGTDNFEFFTHLAPALHGQAVPPLSYDGLVTLVALLGLAVAIALILLGEGVRGAMGLPEVLSHILSYTRLIGILLSTVVLSLIVIIGFHGFLGLAASAPSIGVRIGEYAAATGIIVMGLGFVLILSVFEPGIQGARLIFVEHFSKFYEGNGRPFAPFRTGRVYTRPFRQEEGPEHLIIAPGVRP